MFQGQYGTSMWLSGRKARPSWSSLSEDYHLAQDLILGQRLSSASPWPRSEPSPELVQKAPGLEAIAPIAQSVRFVKCV